LLAEVAVGYHIGDHIFAHLDEKQLAAHFFLIRYFILKAPLRFRLLLTTRSLADVMSRVWSTLDASLANRISKLSDSLSTIWMLEAKPIRIAASVLGRMGGLDLRSHRVFDSFITSVQSHV